MEDDEGEIEEKNQSQEQLETLIYAFFNNLVQN